MKIDKYEIRRLRLLELRDRECGGNTSELARKLDRNPTYVLRMLYPEGKEGKKRIADDMIELISSVFNLPLGWLDGKDITNTINWPFESVSPKRYHTLSTTQKDAIENSVKTMVDAFLGPETVRQRPRANGV